MLTTHAHKCLLAHSPAPFKTSVMVTWVRSVVIEAAIYLIYNLLNFIYFSNLSMTKYILIICVWVLLANAMNIWSGSGTSRKFQVSAPNASTKTKTDPNYSPLKKIEVTWKNSFTSYKSRVMVHLLCVSNNFVLFFFLLNNIATFGLGKYVVWLRGQNTVDNDY